MQIINFVNILYTFLVNQLKYMVNFNLTLTQDLGWF